MSAPGVVMAATGMMVVTGVVVVVMMVMVMVMVMVMARPSLCARSNQAKRRRYSQDSTRHRYSLSVGKIASMRSNKPLIGRQLMPKRRGSNARKFIPLVRF
jgi:uncharacterized membrane protein